MATLNVKLPEDQKKKIEKIADLKNYNSTSEYVREALRDKVENDMELRSEVVKRLQQVREGDVETLSLKEARKELGLT